MFPNDLSHDKIKKRKKLGTLSAKSILYFMKYL